MLEGSLLFLKDYQANLPSIIFSIFQHFQQFLALSAIFSRALNSLTFWFSKSLWAGSPYSTYIVGYISTYSI